MMLKHVSYYYRLPLLMIAWGTMACLHATINGFASLVILRFLLGVFESGFFPVRLTMNITTMTWEIGAHYYYAYLGSDLFPYPLLQEE